MVPVVVQFVRGAGIERRIDFHFHDVSQVLRFEGPLATIARVMNHRHLLRGKKFMVSVLDTIRHSFLHQKRRCLPLQSKTESARFFASLAPLTVLPWTRQSRPNSILMCPFEAEQVMLRYFYNLSWRENAVPMRAQRAPKRVRWSAESAVRRGEFPPAGEWTALLHHEKCTRDGCTSLSLTLRLQ